VRSDVVKAWHNKGIHGHEVMRGSERSEPGEAHPQGGLNEGRVSWPSFKQSLEMTSNTVIHTQVIRVVRLHFGGFPTDLF
jgi:hypothetical protein